MHYSYKVDWKSASLAAKINHICTYQCESCPPHHICTYQFWYRKCFSDRIPHPDMNFHCQNPFQNIYISTACNVRMMLERIAIVRIPCMVRWIHIRTLRVTRGGSTPSTGFTLTGAFITKTQCEQNGMGSQKHTPNWLLYLVITDSDN